MALRGDKLLLLQKYKIETQMGINNQLVENNQRIFDGAYKIILNKNLKESVLKDSLSHYFSLKYGVFLPETQKNNLIKQLANPWMVAFIRLNPGFYLKKLICPILAINGSKDLQVSSKENLDLMKNIFMNSKNGSVDIKELKNLNHLFQECKTGSINEYAKIEQTISPVALNKILNWILKQVK